MVGAGPLVVGGPWGIQVESQVPGHRGGKGKEGVGGEPLVEGVKVGVSPGVAVPSTLGVVICGMGPVGCTDFSLLGVEAKGVVSGGTDAGGGRLVLPRGEGGPPFRGLVVCQIWGHSSDLWRPRQIFPLTCRWHLWAIARLRPFGQVVWELLLIPLPLLSPRAALFRSAPLVSHTWSIGFIAP